MRNFARWRDEEKVNSPANLARMMLDESGYTGALQAEKAPRQRGVWKTSPNWCAPWRITKTLAPSSSMSRW